MSVVTLNQAQTERILEAFHTTEKPQAHQLVWLRRSYAPMHIHEPLFDSLRVMITQALPDYSIAFDVVFESNGGVVDFHCDYESLGPFDVDDYRRSIAESHFKTIHFNLTENGGSLRTLPWVWLSQVHYWCIVTFGIFSLAHNVLNWVCAPLFRAYAREASNIPRLGNAFDNMRLHSVSSGAPRTSYVVRLVKKGCVSMTRDSVERGIARSAACAAFTPLAEKLTSTPVDAADVAWADVFR